MQSCTQLPNGSYSKDLALVEQDLSRICLVDNSPICYSVNESAYPPRVFSALCRKPTVTSQRMVSRSKAGHMTRRTRHYSTFSLCWIRCALQATSDVYSVSAVTHDVPHSFPTDTEGNDPIPSLRFSLLFALITSTGLLHRIHYQSFHNFIAHLRLRLDANMRSACFIAHMCTCIPLFLGFSETSILFLPTQSRIETYCIEIN